MLVVTRKSNEELVIDGPCRIKLLSLCGLRAKIGIEAEPHVKILRSELVDGPEEPDTEAA